MASAGTPRSASATVSRPGPAPPSGPGPAHRARRSSSSLRIRGACRGRAAVGRTVSLTSGLARDSYEAVTDSPRPGWPPCCGYRRCCELRGRAAAQMSQWSRRMLSNPDPPGRIMVVDDDATIVDVVRRYLIRDGHEVECVPDGAAAPRLGQQEPPDLVVLDLMLPGI